MKRPDTLAEVLAAAAENARYWSPTWTGYLDTFYMEPSRRQAMIDPEPPMTGNA